MIAVILSAVLAFYYIARARSLNDGFSLFIGIGFLANASIDSLHVFVSYIFLDQQLFLKYFIPQTWFVGRIYLSAMLAIAIIKYPMLSKDSDFTSSSSSSVNLTSGQLETSQSFENDLYYSHQREGSDLKNSQHRNKSKLQKSFLIPLIVLSTLSAGIAIGSLFFIFPGSVIDNYPIHRPYEIPALVLFLVALVYFYKNQLYKRNDTFYKGILGAILIDIFGQIIMSYSATSFDTAHNVAHVLKDAGYFVNIIGLALSSIQYNAELKESNRKLREKEQLIREQYEKLKESDKMKTEFINVAAHELRTPIQPILGLIEIIHSKTKDPQQQELLEITIRNAKRLQQLTENILDVTKFESKSISLKKEWFNLNDIITNSIDDIITNIAFRNKRNLKLLYQPTDIFIRGDKPRITQVISNLLNNAVKFTDKGTITVTITSTTEKKDNQVIVSINDTGVGIHPEVVPKLFSKFTSKSFQGTGLGLYICKSIIESHGGRIWAENNSDGKGATFTFSLPISK